MIGQLLRTLQTFMLQKNQRISRMVTRKHSSWTTNKFTDSTAHQLDGRTEPVITERPSESSVQCETNYKNWDQPLSFDLKK